MNASLTLTAALAALVATPALAAPPTTVLTNSNAVFNSPMTIDNDYNTYAYSAGSAPNACPFTASGYFEVVGSGANATCRYNNAQSPANGQIFKAWAAYQQVMGKGVAGCGVSIYLKHALGRTGFGSTPGTVLFWSRDNGATWQHAVPSSIPGLLSWYTNVVASDSQFRVILGRTEAFPSPLNSRRLHWHELDIEVGGCN